MEISVDDAVIMALDNNKSLQIERLDPTLKILSEERQRAAFDANVSASADYSETKNATGTTSDRTTGDVEISKLLHSGAEVSVGLSGAGSSSSPASSRFSNRVGVSVRKPLFKGAGSGANLADLRQAGVDVEISKWELLDFTQALVAQVEKAYWDYALSARSMDIYKESFVIAEKQYDETKVMIEIGKKAGIDLVAAEAEVASRREDLIRAKGNLETLRLKLLRLINPKETDYWDRDVIVKDALSAPEIEVGDAAGSVGKALAERPDINQARLSLEKNELDVVKTENGLLPDLNFILKAGKTAYDDSYGGAFKVGDARDVSAGLEYQYALGRRDDRVRHGQSLLQKDQAAAAVENLELLIQQDVRIAFVELDTAREQIAATRATRALNEEKYKAEVEKYRVGRSTPLDVAQAQRDFTASEIAEARAVVGYIESLIDLFVTDGSLLERRGISVTAGE